MYNKTKIIFFIFSVSSDLLEIITIYLTQETFLITINVENYFAAAYFVWKFGKSWPNA